MTVISYALWKERFHSDPHVLGTTIDLDRRPYTVIGVMPRSFEFPLDAGGLSHRDLWVPMSFTTVEKKSEGNNFDYSALARLRPGITMPLAQQDVDRIIEEIQAQYPAGGGLRLHGYFIPLREEVIRNARPLLRILLGAVATDPADRVRQSGKLALSESCRAQARIWCPPGARCRPKDDVAAIADGEPGVKLYRGCRGGGFGGCSGAGAAAKLPDSLPRLSEIAVSWPLLVAATVLTGISGLICGLAPAIAKYARRRVELAARRRPRRRAGPTAISSEERHGGAGGWLGDDPTGVLRSSVAELLARCWRSIPGLNPPMY